MQPTCTPSEQQIADFAHSLGCAPDALLEFPRFFQIETVSLCNARCVMCPVEEWKRDVNIMEEPLFQKILEELAKYTHLIRRVTLQLDGEPLIDRKLEARIAALKKIGVKYVAISSNASLMRPARAISIVDSGIDEVSFSIDGASATTFEAIRKRLKFDECVANTENFIKVRNERNPNLKVRVRMTVQEGNAHEVDAFLNYWKPRIGPRDSAYYKLLHNWANWVRDYKLVPEHDPEALNSSPCIAPFGSFVILTDGRVPLCCADFNAAALTGNVKTSTIQAVWQGEVFRRIRETHLNKGRRGMPMCVDCNIWDTAARCESQSS